MRQFDVGWKFCDLEVAFRLLGETRGFIGGCTALATLGFSRIEYLVVSNPTSFFTKILFNIHQRLFMGKVVEASRRHSFLE